MITLGEECRVCLKTRSAQTCMAFCCARCQDESFNPAVSYQRLCAILFVVSPSQAPNMMNPAVPSGTVLLGGVTAQTVPWLTSRVGLLDVRTCGWVFGWINAYVRGDCWMWHQPLTTLTLGRRFCFSCLKHCFSWTPHFSRLLHITAVVKTPSGL